MAVIAPAGLAEAAAPPLVDANVELWLDAGQINPHRSDSGHPALAAGDLLEQWPDLSGRKRNLNQPSENKRPKLMQAEQFWFVRFDGQDDCLRYLGQPTELSTATAFFVVAPHDNPGDFAGLFSANARDRRDYESGFNIDLGPGPTADFSQLNIEGRGFGGAQNLRTQDAGFGSLHLIEVQIDPQAKQMSLWIDGQREGSRPFAPGSFSFQDLTLGARHYTNGPGEQLDRGFSSVDVAEVIIYAGTLDKAESKSVRDHLLAKHAALAEAIPATIPKTLRPGVPLVKVENPDPITMLVPGFQITELPVELTNVNNVRFREDGKLVTLGYNGDVHLLTDTNGDGLEDHAEVFYQNRGSLRGPIGIALTPPGYSKGQGLFVPSKGKLSLIVDTNGDDQADDEIIVAQGWDEIPQNVDAVGVALDDIGNVYFGLGTANYANGYLIGDDGVAKYSLDSDRGTVQKVSADFSKRETVCTGIRFPIAFAFNEHGDLFCTEQEGATWLANGNPFDELLHIRPQLHYGFPPRHPRHNPTVIDEPSTFDFGPQHQSTCGMVFNQPVQQNGPHFGPDWWQNDAIICGESRGKLWRTQLVKTDTGYVAASQLIACLQMLTVDACVAPNGDLVVACHSGPPDWGTGPTGIGKLYRIRMVKPEVPRALACWAESEREVRVTFDRPLDPSRLGQLASRLQIHYGKNVAPGDRFENLSPPYAVVKRQQMMPRFELPINGTSISSDLQTLIIHTAPMVSATNYSLAWSGFPDTASETKDIVRPDVMDVAFSLGGVWAEWEPEAGVELTPWSGWLPHLDLSVSQQLLSQSSVHQPLWDRLGQPGQLKLESQLDLRDILRPAVQPGSSLDYEWPEETATLKLSSSADMNLSSDSEFGIQASVSGGVGTHLIQSAPNGQTPLKISVSLATGPDVDVDLSCSVSTNEDATARPLPLRRFYLPWVEPFKESADEAGETVTKIAEIEGGSWGRGHRLFHRDDVGCAKCHLPQASAAAIGPDLSNLIHRDYDSVMRDIVHPSYAINPDHIGHVIALDDGQILTGVLRNEAGKLVLGDAEGRSKIIDREQIETMQPASVSVMPKGLLEKLSEAEVRDLMTYLLTAPPQMPLDSPLTAPPIRTAAEVAMALAGSQSPAGETRPLNLVLVDGIKDHGPGEHDYPAWKRAWEQLFLADPKLTISTAREFPSDEQLAAADVVIFFQKGSFDRERETKLDAFLKAGGGAVYIHWAVNGNDRSADFARRIGLASHGGNIRYRHGPLSLQIHHQEHPIVRNFQSLQLYDESYWLLSGDPAQVTLLASSVEDGAATPQMWVTEQSGGRVFVSIPGHYSWTFDDPLFRILLLRGIAWTAGEPVDRFNPLVTLGARMSH